MNDEELLTLLRRTAEEEDRAFEDRAGTPEGRALLAPRPGLAEAIAARALAEMGARPPPTPPVAPDAPVTRGRGRAAIVVASAAVLALAASVALRVGRSPDPSVPPYEVAIVAGAEETTRGAPSAPPHLVFRPGQQIALTLRPTTRVGGAVAARAAIVSSAGSWPLAVDARVSDAGVVHMQAAWPNVDVPGTDRRLVVAVGRPDALPSDPARATEPTSFAWRLVRIDIASPTP